MRRFARAMRIASALQRNALSRTGRPITARTIRDSLTQSAGDWKGRGGSAMPSMRACGVMTGLLAVMKRYLCCARRGERGRRRG